MIFVKYILENIPEENRKKLEIAIKQDLNIDEKKKIELLNRKNIIKDQEPKKIKENDTIKVVELKNKYVSFSDGTEINNITPLESDMLSKFKKSTSASMQVNLIGVYISLKGLEKVQYRFNKRSSIKISKVRKKDLRYLEKSDKK